MSDSKYCGAKTKRGLPCKGKPMINGRCRLHGGLTPRGLAHPNTKTGRWSRDLPTRLAARYQESLEDENLLALKDEIALIDSRLSQLLDNLQDGDTRKLWQDLQASWQKYEQAAIEQDTHKAKIALTEIGRLIKRGMAIYANWVEVYGVLDQRRRTVESERKRLVESQQVISSERAMLLIGALLGILRQHITDTHTLQAIGEDIRRLTVIDNS